MNKLIVAAIRCFLMLLVPSAAYAISAQWDLDPISGDWNTAANWTPNGVPNGPADTATFGLSNTTDVSISADTEVNGITFTSAATNSYTIAVNSGLTLTLSGMGITNNSGITQRFFVGEDGHMHFTNNASAGNATILSDFGSEINFFNRSTAASASLIGVESHTSVNFFNSSTAGSALIENPDFVHNEINFFDHSTAGSASLLAGEEGVVIFSGHSSADTATIFGGSDGGIIGFSGFSTAGGATVIGTFTSIFFSDFSQGGTARIELFFHSGFQVGSFLDISGHNAQGVTIGSLEGDEMCAVFLGANNLTIGSNNLSTTYSGGIEGGVAL